MAAGGMVPGSTGRWPVAPGGPPGASDVMTRTLLCGQDPTVAPPPRRLLRKDVSGGPPGATGQRPVLPGTFAPRLLT